jgi:hypothetical protein
MSANRFRQAHTGTIDAPSVAGRKRPTGRFVNTYAIFLFGRFAAA